MKIMYNITVTLSTANKYSTTLKLARIKSYAKMSLSMASLSLNYSVCGNLSVSCKVVATNDLGASDPAITETSIIAFCEESESIDISETYTMDEKGRPMRACMKL